MADADNTDKSDLIALTIDVVSSYVGQNNIRPDDIPAFIASTHAAIRDLAGTSGDATEAASPAEEHVPAVSVRKSLGSRDHIISMIDGKPYKTLRRHLATHGLTPDEYRSRYGLKNDYPMVAPSYSETRKALAQKIGLGRKPREEAPAPQKAPAKAKGGTKAGLAAIRSSRQRNAAPAPEADENSEG
ncbi:MAG: MucR family transcriptional regulator [Methylobacteriaceae bacterium]|nr:MucR family transcriptional regulator [Methylobacteriaceae bacterium]MBV9842576.1 MucR family transcriptional regulator [Sphingomonadaceae bacterium]